MHLKDCHNKYIKLVLKCYLIFLVDMKFKLITSSKWSHIVSRLSLMQIFSIENRQKKYDLLNQIIKIS